MKKITDGFEPAEGPAGMNAPPGIALGTAPEPDFAGSVCLKGEGNCDYLWMIETSFAHGNTQGTFEEGKDPRAVYRSCLRGSEEMDLSGMRVFACNHHSDPEQRSNPRPFVFSKDKLPLVQINKKDK